MNTATILADENRRLRELLDISTRTLERTHRYIKRLRAELAQAKGDR